MCNIRAREALLFALPKIYQKQVKTFNTSHEFWKALESSFEDDEHSKKLRLQSWICVFQDAKMMEDEFVRTFLGKISKIATSIRSQGGTKEDDKVIWKILMRLSPLHHHLSQQYK